MYKPIFISVIGLLLSIAIIWKTVNYYQAFIADQYAHIDQLLEISEKILSKSQSYNHQQISDILVAASNREVEIYTVGSLVIVICIMMLVLFCSWVWLAFIYAFNKRNKQYNKRGTHR